MKTKVNVTRNIHAVLPYEISVSIQLTEEEWEPFARQFKHHEPAHAFKQVIERWVMTILGVANEQETN